MNMCILTRDRLSHTNFKVTISMYITSQYRFAYVHTHMCTNTRRIKICLCILTCIRLKFILNLHTYTQARLGKRTLVIADVPYVHQLLESYVSKMFSLSYSIAALEVHGANAIDHLVHRFTHRCYRGTLIAVGRTDGRLFSQSKGESWILMAMQQCKAIMHLGSGPEIISVGHNPYNNTSLFTQHTTLRYCEFIFQNALAFSYLFRHLLSFISHLMSCLQMFQ